MLYILQKVLFRQKVLFCGVLTYDLNNYQKDNRFCPVTLSAQWAHLTWREEGTQNRDVLEENALDNFFLD